MGGNVQSWPVLVELGAYGICNVSPAGHGQRLDYRPRSGTQLFRSESSTYLSTFVKLHKVQCACPPGQWLSASVLCTTGDDDYSDNKRLDARLYATCEMSPILDYMCRAATTPMDPPGQALGFRDGEAEPQARPFSRPMQRLQVSNHL
jgi:hypothetical protein